VVNLLLFLFRILKISRVLEQTANEGNTLNRVGPALWMSPESLAKQIYSKKSDMWMFGMLVYEIVARREPFADKDPVNISTRIRDEGLTPHHSQSVSCGVARRHANVLE
jgi:hypothetical protein